MRAIIEEVKEVKTLQVVVGFEESTEQRTVTFRFKKDDASDAEVSSDGVNWHDVATMHKAIGAFFERYPPEFSE